MSNANITATTAPLPPYTNARFTCERCGAEYQLCSTDECKELVRMEFESRRFETPACWTCEHVNVIKIDEPAAEIGNAS